MASQAFLKFTFFVLGVSSLLGWNAVLTALDYFSDQYKDFNVPFLFPIPLFIGTCLIGLILPKISNYISLTFRVGYSLVIVCVLILGLPLIAKFFPNDLGFWLSMVLVFFLGLFNSLQQNSCIGAASNLGGEYVGIFFIGTGMSGTIICFFRLICLGAFGAEQVGLGALVYFCVADTWNIFAIIIYFMFQKTPEYKKVQDTVYELNKSSQDDGSEVVSDSLVTGSFEGRHYEHAEEKMGVFKTLLWANQIAFPVPIAVFIIYIQTFTMFPGMALEKKFPSEFQTWVYQFQIIISYLGEYITDSDIQYCRYCRKDSFKFQKVLYGKQSNSLFVVKIWILCNFYLYRDRNGQRIENNWFPFVNLFLFAFLNGYTTGGFMQIGPEKVKEGWKKEKVGFVDGFSLVFGIMIGTFLAIPFSYIKQNN